MPQSAEVFHKGHVCYSCRLAETSDGERSQWEWLHKDVKSWSEKTSFHTLLISADSRGSISDKYLPTNIGRKEEYNKLTGSSRIQVCVQPHQLGCQHGTDHICYWVPCCGPVLRRHCRSTSWAIVHEVLRHTGHWCCRQAASQVSYTATDGGPPTLANHCWTPSIRCARPHGLELSAGRPPRTAGLRVLQTGSENLAFL